MTICRYCMAEVSEREIEAEDGCCPECGALLSAGGGYLGDEDGYDDLDELEDDEYGYYLDCAMVSQICTHIKTTVDFI